MTTVALVHGQTRSVIGAIWELRFEGGVRFVAVTTDAIGFRDIRRETERLVRTIESPQ